MFKNRFLMANLWGGGDRGRLKSAGTAQGERVYQKTEHLEHRSRTRNQPSQRSKTKKRREDISYAKQKNGEEGLASFRGPGTHR